MVEIGFQVVVKRIGYFSSDDTTYTRYLDQVSVSVLFLYDFFLARTLEGFEYVQPNALLDLNS